MGTYTLYVSIFIFIASNGKLHDQKFIVLFMKCDWYIQRVRVPPRAVLLEAHDMTKINGFFSPPPPA